MNRDGLMTLGDYDAYATGLVLDTLEKLDANEFTRESSPSHHSVRRLIVHALETEQFFLSLCQELEPQSLPELASLTDIRRYGEQVEQGIQNWITASSEEELKREIPLPFPIKGQSACLPKWQMLLQAFMHSAQHRSELAVVLGELGHPLPNLDIIVHFVDQKGRSAPME